MTLRKLLRFVLPFAVFVAAVWYVVDSADLPLMVDLVFRSSALLLLATVPITLLSHVVRASRWRRLLSGAPERPSLPLSFSSVMIGYAANTLVPRSGELLRPLVVSRRTSTPYSTALSSVVVERILDLITLLLGIALLLVLKSDLITLALPGYPVSSVIAAFAIPTAALSALIASIAFTGLGPYLVDRWVRPISQKMATTISRLLANVKDGAGALKDRSMWLPVAVESITTWLLYVIPLWLVLNAMPWHGDPFGLDDAAILLVVIAIGVTIAPTPGAVGIYQGFAQIAMMRLYGASATEGLAFGILAWAMNYGVALLVGGVLLILEMQRGLRWADASGAQAQESGES